MSEQRIAKVVDSFIGFEDHGWLSVSLTFDYGSARQGLAHRIFGSASEDPSKSKWDAAHAGGMDYLRRLLLALGVDRWEQVKGRTVLVTCDHTSIDRIDPLPTEHGKAFDIAAWALAVRGS